MSFNNLKKILFRIDTGGDISLFIFPKKNTLFNKYEEKKLLIILTEGDISLLFSLLYQLIT